MTHLEPVPKSEPVVDFREFARLKIAFGGGLALVGFGFEAALTFTPATHGSTAASGMAVACAAIGSAYFGMGRAGIKQRRLYGQEPTRIIIEERLPADQVDEAASPQIEDEK